MVHGGRTSTCQCEGRPRASAWVRHAQQGFHAQLQIAFGQNPLDGALLEFFGELEDVVVS